MPSTSGRVLCGGSFHTVVLHPNGEATSGKCPNVDRDAKGIAAMLSLGKKLPQAGEGSCAGLVALVRHGLPLLLSGPSDSSIVNLGPWRDLYVRYETHGLTVAAVEAIRATKAAPHRDLLAAAYKALRRCKYRPGWMASDVREMTSFLPDIEPKPGTVIAVSDDEVWSIPLQRRWMDTVEKASISVVGRKFVCGVHRKTPGVVYAIGKDHRNFHVVQACLLSRGRDGYYRLKKA